MTDLTPDHGFGLADLAEENDRLQAALDAERARAEDAEARLLECTRLGVKTARDLEAVAEAAQTLAKWASPERKGMFEADRARLLAALAVLEEPQ